jgi:hypothetical protein
LRNRRIPASESIFATNFPAFVQDLFHGHRVSKVSANPFLWRKSNEAVQPDGARNPLRRNVLGRMLLQIRRTYAGIILRRAQFFGILLAWRLVLFVQLATFQTSRRSNMNRK